MDKFIILLQLGFASLYLTSCHNFNRYVVPETLRQWAGREGYRIVRWTYRPGPFSFFATSNVRQVLRVVVETKVGGWRVVWVRIGSPWWFSRSASRCPFEVVWDGPAGAKKVDRPPASAGVWDSQFDR